MKKTISLLILASALPLSAQTAATTKPAVHHTSTTTHSSAPASHCPVNLPLLSAKIPALPATTPKCPAVEYQLSYIDTKIGTGELAASKKWYTVHYTGYLPDGTKFDSSVDRNEPISFPYGAHRVITGWDTGFDGMRVGGKRRLFVPYQLAYGEAGRPPVIPAMAMLIFDVEFVSQSDTQPTPKTPAVAPQSATPPTGAAPAAKPATPPSSTSPAPSPAGATTTTPSGTVTAPTAAPKQ